ADLHHQLDQDGQDGNQRALLSGHQLQSGRGTLGVLDDLGYRHSRPSRRRRSDGAEGHRPRRDAAGTIDERLARQAEIVLLVAQRRRVGEPEAQQGAISRRWAGKAKRGRRQRGWLKGCGALHGIGRRQGGACRVVFPDIPGCVAIGKMITRRWTMRPMCSATGSMSALAEWGSRAFVPLIRETGKPVKANLSIDSSLLATIDTPG